MPARGWRWPGLILAMFVLPVCCGALQLAGPADGSFPDLPNVRGSVQSVRGNDATIQTEEGATYTVHTSDNTRIYRQRQPIKMADVQVGDMLIAAGSLDEKNHLLRAVFVGDVDAATVKKMSAELGKTWIAGKVIKIEDADLTIERIDHKSQVIEADDSTSFRKDGQSITLLDIHPGDPVRGKGVVKNGVFVPTQLTVIDPSRRPRNRTAAGSPDHP